MAPAQRDTLTVDWGQLFDVLSDEYRRRLLVTLLRRDPEDELRLAEAVHRGEKDVETLRIELRHRHLPRLEEADYVEWRRESRTVVAGPRFGEIRPILEHIHTHRDELPAGWLDESP